MKLLGWTIVASALIVGIAACTVTTEDSTTDGGTGTGGTGTGGTGTGGSTAGAGGSTAGSGGTAGTAGAAGAPQCTTTDTSDCAQCAVSKCCEAWTICDNSTDCKAIMTCADQCWGDPDSGVATYADCITGCANGAGSPPDMSLANDYYSCLCLQTASPDGCKTECDAAQMCP